jgi:glycosyltransferase involved in cell wall biosynthesis
MTPDLSIVIPVLNESPNIDRLYNELTDTLVRGGRSYEILIVDDGSTDDTFDRLAVLQSRDPHLRVIRFRRNFGQTAAFAAGFAFARGRMVVTSDGDLQNDPGDIQAMADRIEREGFDIVCGWRKDRKDRMVTRRVPSYLANKLISWATGVELHDYGCSLKVFRAEVVSRCVCTARCTAFCQRLRASSASASPRSSSTTGRAWRAHRNTVCRGPSASSSTCSR